MAIGIDSAAFNGPYVTNGVTVAFPFTFQVLLASQIQVVLVDASGTESVVSSSSYSVSLTGVPPSTGTVTFAVAPAFGNKVYVLLHLPFTQETQFMDGSAWKADPVNKVNDRATLRDQMLRRDLTRTLKMPRGETPPTLGSFEDADGKVLGFVDGQLRPVENSPAAEAALAAAEAAQIAADGANAALATIVGPLATVTRYSPRPVRWTSPSGLLNPLAVAIDCNGADYSYSSDPYLLNDWSQSGAFTEIFWDPINGNDSNTGISESQPWLTVGKLESSAPDRSVITCMAGVVDYNANISGNISFGTRKIKIKSRLGTGTLWTGWRNSYNLATLAWVADGQAYKTTASVNAASVNNMMDGKYRDVEGIPMAMIYVLSSALVKSTPGSWWYDSGTGTLWVHMIDDRVPDPANGWIPCTAFSGANFSTDGELVLENMDFAFHSGGAGLDALRIRPVTAFVANTSKVSLRKIRAYGADGNGIALLDQQVAVLQECAVGNVYRDCFNHSSFISTGAQAQWTTTYEDRCFGKLAGWDQSKSLPAVSNSNNITTGHRGKSLMRVGTRGYGCPNSWVADVQGCYSINAGLFPDESTKAGGLFLNNYWNQKLSGEGVAGAKMVLVGCGGEAKSAGRNVFSNYDDADTTASLGEIHIADWLGPPAASRKTGTIIKNYETGASL
jgi:hypothetical protein